MKLPYLPFWDVTPIKVYITDGSLNQQGEPNVLSEYAGLANVSPRVSTQQNSDGVYVKVSGTTVRIGKDVAPSVQKLSGYVLLEGEMHAIVSSSRPRNPDGSVNHTRLELM